jgi:hypothetical protein
MASRYHRGRAFEYRVASLLRAAGWTVIRSAGSHGPFDLVAVRPARVVLLQLKASFSRPAAQRLERELADQYRLPVYVVTRSNLKQQVSRLITAP